MVRSLDLSNIPNDALDSTGQYLPSAGWREFKHRHSDMYYASQENITLSHKSTRLLQKQKTLTSHQTLKGLEKAPSSSHPPPSRLLESFHRKRDIPVGALCHVLAACRRLRYTVSCRFRSACKSLTASKNSQPFSRPTSDRLLGRSRRHATKVFTLRPWTIHDSICHYLLTHLSHSTFMVTPSLPP